MNTVPDSELLVAGYRYAFALSANKQDAEDLLHDAWLRLVSRYGHSPDKPLLFRTIKNLFVDNLRHNTVVSNYERMERHQSGSHRGEMDSMDSADLLDQHLVKLKHNEREVLFLDSMMKESSDGAGNRLDQLSAAGKSRAKNVIALSRKRGGS